MNKIANNWDIEDLIKELNKIEIILETNFGKEEKGFEKQSESLKFSLLKLKRLAGGWKSPFYVDSTSYLYIKNKISEIKELLMKSSWPALDKDLKSLIVITHVEENIKNIEIGDTKDE